MISKLIEKTKNNEIKWSKENNIYIAKNIYYTFKLKYNKYICWLYLKKNDDVEEDVYKLYKEITTSRDEIKEIYKIIEKEAI